MKSDKLVISSWQASSASRVELNPSQNTAFRATWVYALWAKVWNFTAKSAAVSVPWCRCSSCKEMLHLPSGYSKPLHMSCVNCEKNSLICGLWSQTATTQSSALLERRDIRKVTPSNGSVVELQLTMLQCMKNVYDCCYLYKFSDFNTRILYF